MNPIRLIRPYGPRGLGMGVRTNRVGFPEGTDMNDRWYRTNVTDAFADQVGQETAEQEWTRLTRASSLTPREYARLAMLAADQAGVPIREQRAIADLLAGEAGEP